MALPVLSAVSGAVRRAGRFLLVLPFPGGETAVAKLSRPVLRAFRRWSSRWAEPFFRPDETVAPDPLRPSARVVAAGVARAFERCAAAKPGGFRLLVCRVPGRTVSVRLDAARRRCTVGVSPPGGGGSARAEAALPPFSPGAEPVRFEIGPDNLRLFLRAGPSGVVPVRR